MAIRKPSTYGAKGDGKTDDSDAMARLVAAIKPYDDVVFPTKTYRLSRGIEIRGKSDFRVHFNGATLRIDTSASPQNRGLVVGAAYDTTGKPTGRWQAAIPAGWTPAPRIAQRWMWVGLGTDPFDPNEEHYGTLVPPGASRIWVPRDINGTSHFWTEISSPCEQVEINDASFLPVPGQSCDMCVAFDRARSVRCTGLRGSVGIGCQLMDTEDAELRDFDVTLDYPHQSSGRIAGGWQSRWATMRDMRMKSHRDPKLGWGGDGFFFESWCEHVSIDGVDATRDVPNVGWGNNMPLYFVNGGCRDFTVGRTTIKEDPTAQVYLYDVGGQQDQVQPRFESLEVLSGQVAGLNDYIRNGMKIDRIILPT